MTEQFTNFANVRVEDIPAGLSYCARDGWGAAYRSPEKIKSVNGVMEYHYILEWTMHTPKSSVLIREKYFGSEVICSSYEFNREQIVKVGYSGGDCYYIEKGQVRKETPQPEEQLNQSTEKAATIDEKLDAIIERLDVLEVKLSGENGAKADSAGKPIGYFGAVPDEQPAVSWWEVKMPDDKNPGRAIPFYVGEYVHAETLSGERITVDGEEYLIMRDGAKRPLRVSRETQIVHLMEYEKIELYVLPVAVDGWTVSDGKVAIYGTNEERTVLPNGTKFKVVEYADAINWREIVPGTLAIRYPDYKYPTL